MDLLGLYSMFVSHSLDYAMRSMIHLAHTPERSLSLRELSQRSFIPRSYLAKVMRTLVKSGLVQSDPGSHGGYRMTRGADTISLKEIYESVEGAFHTVGCLSGPTNCELVDECTQTSIWRGVESEIVSVLERRKLSDFLGAKMASSPMVRLEDVA